MEKNATTKPKLVSIATKHGETLATSAGKPRPSPSQKVYQHACAAAADQRSARKHAEILVQIAAIEAEIARPRAEKPAPTVRDDLNIGRQRPSSAPMATYHYKQILLPRQILTIAAGFAALGCVGLAILLSSS